MESNVGVSGAERSICCIQDAHHLKYASRSSIPILHTMQTFIPSVVSTLNALLKGSTWLLQKVIGIFAGWGESLSSHIPSSDLYSPSDSPYELRGVPSQGRACHPHGQISVHSQYPKANRTPSQHSPHRQTSTQHPTQTASLAPRSAPVAKPVKSRVCLSIHHLMFTHLCNP